MPCCRRRIRVRSSPSLPVQPWKRPSWSRCSVAGPGRQGQLLQIIEESLCFVKHKSGTLKSTWEVAKCTWASGALKKRQLVLMTGLRSTKALERSLEFSQILISKTTGMKSASWRRWKLMKCWMSWPWKCAHPHFSLSRDGATIYILRFTFTSSIKPSFTSTNHAAAIVSAGAHLTCASMSILPG